MVEALSRLLHLERGWDSYGGQAIDPRCAEVALERLNLLLPADAPAPRVVPTCAGDIQLEWHTRGIDLEIEISSAARVAASFDDCCTGEAWSEERIYDFARLRRAMRELSRPQ